MSNNQTLRFDKGTLLLESAPPPHLRDFFKWDRRAEAWRCDASHYTNIKNALNEESPGCVASILPVIKLHWPLVGLLPLRDDQEEAIQKWMKSHRGVIVMPTGTGKTEVALHIMHRLSVTTLVVYPLPSERWRPSESCNLERSLSQPCGAVRIWAGDQSCCLARRAIFDLLSGTADPKLS